MTGLVRECVREASEISARPGCMVWVLMMFLKARPYL